jgi:hypothetical protein
LREVPGLRVNGLTADADDFGGAAKRAGLAKASRLGAPANKCRPLIDRSAKNLFVFRRSQRRAFARFLPSARRPRSQRSSLIENMTYHQ